MCGIFGYVGKSEAEPLLLEGLRTLEYRGYDSAGIYMPGQGVVKAVGQIAELEKSMSTARFGTSGIAHTRWATHGEPTMANAHPHVDSSGQIWLVHNGIIENYQELKAELQAKGVEFTTKTDTEVLVQLIGSLYTGDLVKAVQAATKRVRGTYGIAVMHEAAPAELVVARMGSPIVLGIAADGYLVSSDTAALLAHTKEVVHLEDGEIAVIRDRSYQVMTAAGTIKNKTTERVEWDIAAVQKSGYDHFMLKEIFEAPEVIENTIRGRLLADEGNAKLGGLESVGAQLAELDRLQIVGCGSAYYAGQVGRCLLEEYARLPVEVELGSEYRYKQSHLTGNSAVVAVSQSGETADTLASVRKAKAENLLTLGIINNVGSSIARETDVGVYNHAGPEIAVASTKAFISQLTVFALLTLLLGRQRGVSKAEGKEMVAALQSLPATLASMLKDTTHIQAIAKRYAEYRDAIYIGRKFQAPIAYEGALKLKEVAYIHAEAYAGGELKHGPIAMLDQDFPVIALAPRDEVYEKMVSNIEEVKARRAPVLALVTEGDTSVADIVDDVISLPDVHPIVQPIVATVPLHLFAYYVGVAKGLNVDRPRNLAKSVTVE